LDRIVDQGKESTTLSGGLTDDSLGRRFTGIQLFHFLVTEVDFVDTIRQRRPHANMLKGKGLADAIGASLKGDTAVFIGSTNLEVASIRDGRQRFWIGTLAGCV
jgi:hypothetical protein